MFCSQCGKEIPDGATSCPACGAPLGRAGAAAASGDGPKPATARHRGGRVRAGVIAAVVLVVALVAGGTGYYFWQREQNAVWVPTSFKIEGQGEAANESWALLYSTLPIWFPYPSVSWTNRFYGTFDQRLFWDQASFDLTDGGAYEGCDVSFGDEEVPLEALLDDHGNYVGVRNTDTGEEFKGSYTYDDQGRPLTYSGYTSATFSYADDGSYQVVVGDQSSGPYVLYRYDSNGRAVSREEHEESDGVASVTSYDYENGVIASSGDYDFVTGRDDEGRITSATYFGDWHLSFEYDENGNVTKVSYEWENEDGTVYSASLSIGYEKVYDPTPLVRTLGGNILV